MSFLAVSADTIGRFFIHRSFLTYTRNTSVDDKFSLKTWRELINTVLKAKISKHLFNK